MLKPPKKEPNTWLGTFTNEQAYTLDVAGLYIYKNFIDTKEVNYINTIIDKHLKDLSPQPSKYNFFELNPIFMDIISRPWVIDACRATVGEYYRLDHVIGIQQPGQIKNAKNGQWIDQGYIIGNIHGGWHSGQSSCYYHSTETRIASGHMTLGIFLSEQNNNTGGFCFMPGSHKQANVSSGKDIFNKILNGNYEHQLIKLPNLNKGDLVFFPESLIHGTTPLKPPCTRRAIYFVFLPGFATWRPYEEVKGFMNMAKTEIQKRMLRPPYCANIIDEAGRMSDNFYKKPTAEEYS